ncbi:hypothetical protein NLX86_13495 [Streptomyces sp. A3M-1-3]|uniref:DUF7848 domain-containing protein n=1 Tax=Streptomyces sp. A3M-1-3 TaxID=2962044 RepID=UPI0020B83327|nr:hypothetical protein [Streptomyces sp. A3M-1-3]MCP3819090.1 hypothetical protein [Streptomyces sp. A3M-1-3]
MTALRAAYRYVVHKVTQLPDTEVIFEAQCLCCDWEAAPSTDSAAVDVEAMTHTGRSGHGSFRRICTSFAIVVRAER